MSKRMRKWLLLEILPLLHWGQRIFPTSFLSVCLILFFVCYFYFVCLYLIALMEIKKFKIIHITVCSTSLLSWPMKLPVVHPSKNNLRTGSVLLAHIYWEGITCKWIQFIEKNLLIKVQLFIQVISPKASLERMYMVSG